MAYSISSLVTYRAPMPEPTGGEPANKGHRWCCPRRVHPVTNYLSGCTFLKRISAPFWNPAISFKEADLAPMRVKVLSKPGVFQVKIATYDGAGLDGVLVRSRLAAKAAVLLVLGRQNCYEQIAKDGTDGEPEYISHKLFRFLQERVCKDDVDLLVINVRGIGLSTGEPSYEGWTTDVYSAIRFLESRGYPAITTYGYSAGGWISVEPVKRRQRELASHLDPKPCISLVTDRSPKDLALAAYYVSDKYIKEELAKGTRFEASFSRSRLGSFVAGVVSNAVYLAAKHSEWSAPVDVSEVVSGTKLAITVRDDEFVHEHAGVRRAEDGTHPLEPASDYHLEFTAPHGEGKHVASFPLSVQIEVATRIRKMLNVGDTALSATDASYYGAELRRRYSPSGEGKPAAAGAGAL